MEFEMQVEAQAATRSPAFGLRVGAAVLTPDAHVLAAGRNHHSSADGSPAYDAGVVDLRQMLSNLLSLMEDEKSLKKSSAAKLDADPENTPGWVR